MKLRINRNAIGEGLYVAGIVVAGLVCFFLTKTLTFTQIATGDISVAPFTQERESYSFENDPKGSLVSKETVAMRADGAEAILTTAMGNVGLDQGFSARKVVFPDGRMLTLMDWIQAKSTWPRISAQQILTRNSRMSRPPENCIAAGETLMGFGDLLGHKVAIVGWPHQTGAQRVIQWQAPDLGCQSLLDRVQEQQSDGSWKLDAETRTTSLILGQPDPKYFDAGAGYTEMSPSQMLQRSEAFVGAAPTDDIEQSAKVQDKAYYGQLGR